MRILRKLYATIVYIFEAIMNAIGFTVLSVHSTLKFLLGLFSILAFVSIIYLGVKNLWLIIASGGEVLDAERDIIFSLLTPVFMLTILIGTVVWRIWREGLNPPRGKDLRK